MQRGNISGLNVEKGNNRAYLLGRSRPSPLPATGFVVGELRRLDRGNISRPRGLSRDPARGHTDPSPALAVPQAQLVFENAFHGKHHGSGQVPFDVYQTQHRTARHARPPVDVLRRGSDESSQAPMADAPRASVQYSHLSYGERVVSVDTFLSREAVGLHSQLSGYLLPSTSGSQPHGMSQCKQTPITEAQQAALGLPRRNISSNDYGNPHKDAASKLQIVYYGEDDPEKPWKRRDNQEDKQRKEAICREQGACLNCKRARRQCNGGSVCNRCHKQRFTCIRTCNLCWSKKKLTCDEGIRCKSCEDAGISCVRPQPSTARTEDLDPFNLSSVLSQELRSTNSSARVNEHNMLETERQIPGPTAWNATFGVAAVPPNIDMFNVMGTASDGTLLGSQPYSQQSADVDLRRTWTSGSTRVGSDDSTLQVPSEQHFEFESCSETTDSTFYAEAMLYSDQGLSEAGSLDLYAWNAQEDMF